MTMKPPSQAHELVRKICSSSPAGGAVTMSEQIPRLQAEDPESRR